MKKSTMLFGLLILFGFCCGYGLAVYRVFTTDISMTSVKVGGIGEGDYIQRFYEGYRWAENDIISHATWGVLFTKRGWSER